MYYYNQLDYEDVDYSYNSNNKTVATSGCGVCAALCILNNYYNTTVMSVKEMASFAKKCGARVWSGTNMSVLLNALSKKYDISYTTTSKNSELLNHIKSGKFAIINQGDEYNVFSTAGHYVVGFGIDGKDNIKCLDPQYYYGKYSKSPRKNRIEKADKEEVWVNLKEVGKATIDRNPSYYLVNFTGKASSPKPPKITVGKTYVTNAVRNVYKYYYASSGRKKVKELTKDGRKHATSKNQNSYASLKTGTKITVLAKKTNKFGNLWVKIPSGWISVWNSDGTSFIR